MIDYSTNLDGLNWETVRRDLIDDSFHNGRTTAQLRDSFANSQGVAIARDDGRCIAMGRLLSDGVGNAYVVDVWTHSTYRRRGIGHRIMELLLDMVPGQHVYLQADDAIEFYEKLGFSEQPKGMSTIVGQYLQQ